MKDFTEGGLEKIREFARQTGQSEQFEQTLNTMVDRENRSTIGGGEPGESEVRIYNDWAFMSLSFVWWSLKNNRMIFNGGIIYHGPHDGYGDGGAPTFSVCLTPTNGWSIHT